MFSLFDKEFQQMFDAMHREFRMPFSNSRFDNWDLSEPESDSEELVQQDPEHTTYRMKTVINDNGRVTVKTVRKDPGSKWETHVRQYNAGNAIEGTQNLAAIEEAGEDERESMVQEKSHKHDMQDF